MGRQEGGVIAGGGRDGSLELLLILTFSSAVFR